MRQFKTAEALERERLESLGLIPFKLPTDKILVLYARQSTKGQVFKRKESALQQTAEQLEWASLLGDDIIDEAYIWTSAGVNAWCGRVVESQLPSTRTGDYPDRKAL